MRTDDKIMNQAKIKPVNVTSSRRTFGKLYSWFDLISLSTWRLRDHLAIKYPFIIRCSLCVHASVYTRLIFYNNLEEKYRIEIAGDFLEKNHDEERCQFYFQRQKLRWNWFGNRISKNNIRKQVGPQFPDSAYASFANKQLQLQFFYFL